MATKLYLPSDNIAPAFEPAAIGGWEDTSLINYTTMPTIKRSSAMTTASFADASAANRDILFKIFVSAELTAGQTVTGSQAIKLQARCSQVAATNNMLLTVVLAIWNSSNPAAAAKAMVGTVRDNVEAATSLTNRQHTTTSAAGNYTTVAGDYVVLQLGMGGDPDVGSDHDSSLRFGDAAASDLPEDDTDTTDLNPWVQLTDTLTFIIPGVRQIIASQGSARNRGGIGIRQMRRRDSGLYVPAYLEMAA